MAQTNSYGLRQWEIHEGNHREDLNQAIAGVDSALGRVAEGAAGKVAALNQDLTGRLTTLNNNLTGQIATINSNAAGLAAKIEALEGGKAKIVLGTYHGDNASNRDISLGFQPRAVLLEIQFGKRADNGDIYGGLAFPDTPLYNAAAGNALTITSNGFRVYFDADYLYTNQTGNTYLYLAVL